MPITEKEALDYIGVDVSKFENIDAFKEGFDGDWVKISEAANNTKVAGVVFGKHAGQLATRAKNALKGYGVEIGESELKEAKLYDLIDMVTKAGNDFHGKVITELKSQVEASKGGGKEAQELQSKLATALKDLEDHKTLSADLKIKLENQGKEYAEKERRSKEDAIWGAAFDKAPFKKDLDPYARKGFIADMRSKYKLTFNDDGTHYPVGADGHRIKDTAKSNAFLDLDGILANEVTSNKLHEANPHAGKQVGVKSTLAEPPQQVATPPGQRVRVPHPNAVVQ